MRNLIQQYDKYGEENSISTDLEFMKHIAKKRKTSLSKRKREMAFFSRLWNRVYPAFRVDSNFCISSRDSASVEK